MANTILQIKRSTTTATPPNGSLLIGELAYSYTSNIAYIGTSDGNGVLEIGGKYWTDTIRNAYDKANTANLLAYNTGSGANAYLLAVIAGANAAVGAGANAYATAVGAAANAYMIAVQNGSNTAVGTAANAFASATIAGANAAVGAGANSYAAAVGVSANAYSAATFLPLAGGTITGSLVVQGNATFSGTVTYANTQTLMIGDNILSLNADLPIDVAPSENAGMEVNRGSSANTLLIWNEGIDKWQFTENGSVYYNIPTNTAVESAQTISTAAYDKANAANLLAYNTGIGANAFTSATIAGANAAVGAGANSYAAAVGAAANAYMIAVQNGSNTAVGTGANAYAAIVGSSANAYLLAVIAGANTAVGTGANAYAAVVGAAANTNASNASYLSIGTVPSARISGSYTGITGVGTITTGTWNGSTITVPYGGTGVTSFTANGVVFGNGSGALKVTAQGSEGNVLQVAANGVPVFGMLDGGTF